LRTPLSRESLPDMVVCWIEGGAGFFLFGVLPGGAAVLHFRQVQRDSTVIG
jgi:hypothetical protein